MTTNRKYIVSIDEIVSKIEKIMKEEYPNTEWYKNGVYEINARDRQSLMRIYKRKYKQEYIDDRVDLAINLMRNGYKSSNLSPTNNKSYDIIYNRLLDIIDLNEYINIKNTYRDNMHSNIKSNILDNYESKIQDIYIRQYGLDFNKVTFNFAYHQIHLLDFFCVYGLNKEERKNKFNAVIERLESIIETRFNGVFKVNNINRNTLIDIYLKRYCDNSYNEIYILRAIDTIIGRYTKSSNKKYKITYDDVYGLSELNDYIPKSNSPITYVVDFDSIVVRLEELIKQYYGDKLYKNGVYEIGPNEASYLESNYRAKYINETNYRYITLGIHLLRNGYIPSKLSTYALKFNNVYTRMNNLIDKNILSKFVINFIKYSSYFNSNEYTKELNDYRLELQKLYLNKYGHDYMRVVFDNVFHQICYLYDKFYNGKMSSSVDCIINRLEYLIKTEFNGVFDINAFNEQNILCKYNKKYNENMDMYTLLYILEILINKYNNSNTNDYKIIKTIDTINENNINNDERKCKNTMFADMKTIMLNEINNKVNDNINRKVKFIVNTYKNNDLIDAQFDMNLARTIKQNVLSYVDEQFNINRLTCFDFKNKSDIDYKSIDSFINEQVNNPVASTLYALFTKHIEKLDDTIDKFVELTLKPAVDNMLKTILTDNLVNDIHREFPIMDREYILKRMEETINKKLHDVYDTL